MPIAPLSRSEIEEKLRHENLDEWQKLWWASQGDDLAFADWTLMAAAVPFPETQALSVLDLCCGPGDAGRFMHRRFHQATVDRLDRDSFFLALSGALNRRSRVPGESYSRDLWDPRWRDGLPRDYHVAVVTASLHWLDVQRLGEIFRGVLKLLRAGGVFLFAEPACTNAKFAAALANWKPCIPHTYDPAPGIDSGNGRTHCSVTTKALFWARVPSVRSRSAIAAFPFSSTLRCCPMPASDRSMCYAGRASTS